MRGRLLVVLLTLGTIGGFAAGFRSMAHRHHDRRAAFERHVASVCVDAARRTWESEGTLAGGDVPTPADSDDGD